MPEVAENQLDWRTGLQLALLVMALPAQYLLVNYSSVSQQDSQQALIDLMARAQQMSTDLLSWPAWQKWCISVIDSISSIHYMNKRQDIYKTWKHKPTSITNSHGESPALEVIRLEDSEGLFANSPVVRSPRHPKTKYRVGQVITHRQLGYRGVIIGWDPYAKAPAEWLEKNHPAGMHVLRTQPNYAILVDTRDRPHPQITYVPQDNIQLALKTQIYHPVVHDYFDQYRNGRYIARPALKELYPDD